MNLRMFWVLVLVAFFAGCAGPSPSSHASNDTKVTEKEAYEWVQAICTQHYLPLGSKGKVLVFIEVSTSREPWVGGNPTLALANGFLRRMATENVRFVREQEFETEIVKIDKGVHVLRATFFPFAASLQTVSDSIEVPVKDGDIMKWRQSLFKLKCENSGVWRLISVE